MNATSSKFTQPLSRSGSRQPGNFYITNGSVLVPTFNDKNDRIALGIISDCFPKREVIGMHATDLVWGLGTLHCLAHEEPV
jgi:agmatine deiminase